MIRDPDMLQITRQRRRDGRCVACGAHPPRGTPGPRKVICDTCKARRRAYCPACERAYTHPDYRTCQRTSMYCPDCNRENCRRKRGGATMDERKQAWRAQSIASIKPILRLYRKGLAPAEIAAQLGISTSALHTRIVAARNLGIWPEHIRRRKRPSPRTRGVA